MQESGLENKSRRGKVIADDGTLVDGITDVGVFQIHVDTIASLKSSGIDPERLKTDIDYQAYWHARILKSKVKICRAHDEPRLQGLEWSCYHSFTFKRRWVYIQDVIRYLDQLL